MRSVLEICHNYLRSEVTKTESLIDNIKRSKMFLAKSGSYTAEGLLDKKRRAGFSNITQWYRSNDLTLSFISVSMSCRRALNYLPPDERSDFPSDAVLLRNRISILRDSNMRAKIGEILGDDILTSGISMEQN
jgi:hypothetical protein